MNMTQITRADLENVLTTAIADDAKSIEIHNQVRSVLEKFVGKTINKRVETALAKATGWTVYLDGGNCLKVWGGTTGVEYTNRYLIYFRNSHAAEFDLEQFEHSDTCHGRSAIARNVRRAELLASTVKLVCLAAAVNKILQAKQVLNELLLDLDPEGAECWASSELKTFVENTLK